MSTEGVWFDATTKKWRAQLVEDGETMKLGSTETREEAERKFKQAWAKVREDRPVPSVVPMVGGSSSTSPVPPAAVAASANKPELQPSAPVPQQPPQQQTKAITLAPSAGSANIHPSAPPATQSPPNAQGYVAQPKPNPTTIPKPAPIAQSAPPSSTPMQSLTSLPTLSQQRASIPPNENRNLTSSSEVSGRSVSEPIPRTMNATASKQAGPFVGTNPSSAATLNAQSPVGASATLESKHPLQPQQQAAASRTSSSSNAVLTSAANSLLGSGASETTARSTATTSTAAKAILTASTANSRSSLPLIGGECKCGNAVCNLNPSKRTEIWQHSRVCKRPKVCGLVMCERLQQAGTDDIQEAWAKLERDVHPAPIYTPRVRPTRRDTHFPKLDGEFIKSDADFFGTGHLNPNANVLMTGMYNPLTKTMSGKWTVIQRQPLENPAELPPHNSFTFACSSENIIDPNSSQPCPICLSGEETTENSFVVCDLCDRPYHLFCIGLLELPKEDFYCSKCVEILEQYGVDIPPTRMWKGRFEIFDTKKKAMKTVPDDVYFNFDYSRASGSSIAVITGKGKNEFGSFTIKGVLKRLGNSFPFQFAKTFDIANHSAT